MPDFEKMGTEGHEIGMALYTRRTMAAKEYLLKIREQEGQASETKRGAQAEAKRLISVAKDEAAAIVKRAQAEADALHKEGITKAEGEAALDYERIIHKAEWECKMLSESAEKNSAKAIGLVVKKVVG
ncbi:MAG: hypothetical protein FWH32_03870 [Clostridiales bacterium]|nr:hypothetical protein [Clostridiales bacterium]